jgi:hypothetical protein
VRREACAQRDKTTAEGAEKEARCGERRLELEASAVQPALGRGGARAWKIFARRVGPARRVARRGCLGGNALRLVKATPGRAFRRAQRRAEGFQPQRQREPLHRSLTASVRPVGLLGADGPAPPKGPSIPPPRAEGQVQSSASEGFGFVTGSAGRAGSSWTAARAGARRTSQTKYIEHGSVGQIDNVLAQHRWRTAGGIAAGPRRLRRTSPFANIRVLDALRCVLRCASGRCPAVQRRWRRPSKTATKTQYAHGCAVEGGC